MLVCSDTAVAAVLDLAELLDVVEDAFAKQGHGAVTRPERPHFPVGQNEAGEDPAGTGLAMPAYIHGADHYATKLVGVHEGNVDRDLPTVQAQLVLTRADTGEPAALLAGERITNARTGCIGGVAARHLAPGDGPVTLGVIGAGTQARWQTCAVDAAVGVDGVRVYAPSDSRQRCAADFRDRGLAAEAVGRPAAAVADADVVVTATTATEPVFPGEALSPGTLVVAVGAYDESMRELDAETVARADALYGDVPAEVAATGDFPTREVEAFTPLSAAVLGDVTRTRDSEVTVVGSVGSATLDAAVGEHVYERLCERSMGTELSL
ncbi:MAG: ornithine cyclodeaminase family protein [Halolamina sp.]